MANQGSTVTVGSSAPAFTLPTPAGQPRSLAEYLARGAVLLAFHRGIW